ncbi:MAG: ATP-grasp domain-containing protein, partial [Candidatus Bathyarchaeia archaeon]
MNLLVYEHVSGGGFAGTSIPEDILCEGFAMLRTLTHDLRAMGHRITLPIDLRLKPLAALLRAERIIPVKSKRMLLKTLREAAHSLEAAYIIAPEGILPSLIEAVEEAGVLSLNCTPDAIRAAADKAKAQRVLAKAGLNVPETVEAYVDESPSALKLKAKELGFPVVFKPPCGVSCAGLSLVKGEGQIPAAIKRVKHETGSKRFLIQKFIRGVHASVSLIATAQKATPLTLNRQWVRLEAPSGVSSYEGGVVPLEHPLKNEAFRAAEKALSLFNGLRGYVGVDLVLTWDKAYVMEINPRLTTSYVGLRRVLEYNPAQAIVDAAVHGVAPGKGQTTGFAAFQKLETSNLSPGILDGVCSMEGGVTPPMGMPSYAFIEAYGLTL